MNQFKELLSPLANKKMSLLMLTFEAKGRMTITQAWIAYNQLFREHYMKKGVLEVYTRNLFNANLLKKDRWGNFVEYYPHNENLKKIKNKIEKVNKAMKDESDYLDIAKRFRLTDLHLKILNFIEKEKPISVEIIHIKTGIDLGQLSRELKKLQKFKWIQLVRNPEDRRNKIPFLTKQYTIFNEPEDAPQSIIETKS